MKPGRLTKREWAYINHAIAQYESEDLDNDDPARERLSEIHERTKAKVQQRLTQGDIDALFDYLDGGSV